MLASSYDSEMKLLLACRNTLEILDITFCPENHSRYWLAAEREWFLPRLRLMIVRGRYDQAIENRSSLDNHIPPEAAVQYDYNYL